MIVSAFTDLKDGLVNFFGGKSLGSNKNPIEPLILKKDYKNYIRTFDIGELKFPTEEESRKAYESRGEHIHKFELWRGLLPLINGGIRNKYKIENGEFVYLGSLEYLSGSHIGVSNYTMNLYNAIFYRYVYLKKPIETDSPLDGDFNLEPAIPILKKRFQETRELLGRISLYEEVFKKLDMPEDLEMCLNFKDISIRTISMIVFLIRVIELSGL